MESLHIQSVLDLVMCHVFYHVLEHMIFQALVPIADHVMCSYVSLWHVSLVSQDHMLVRLLGLLMLSLYFDLELVILCLCMMLWTASMTVSPL